jgi:3-dehydroquinate synthase
MDNFETISIGISRKSARYAIRIGDHLLPNAGEWAIESLGGRTGKIAIISNKKVFGHYGDVVAKSLRKAGFKVFIHLIGDGERYKNLRTLERTLSFLNENGIARTDAVVALGGGVVGDVAGFVASVHLRGIDLLQIPTTLLAMIDASVGGKTGVNSAFGKNLIGSFYQPRGVLIDISTLPTLEHREITAGYCEAIKHGALSGRQLFDRTASFIEKNPCRLLASNLRSGSYSGDAAEFVAKQVRFKASIIGKDERESPGNTSAGSRKILNFGHTFAHALERASKYKYVKHGEAVGHGILFAAELAKKLEICAQDVVILLCDVVRRAGELMTLRNVALVEVAKAFDYDKKKVNDSLQWVLLEDIGKPVIVPQEEVPRLAVFRCLEQFLRG